jgi:hypothetical protein
LIAKGWRFIFRRRAWLAVGIALLVSASAFDAETAETKPTKRRAPNVKAAAKTTKVAEKAPNASKSYDIDFKEFKLNNGLRVLLAPRDAWIGTPRS